MCVFNERSVPMQSTKALLDYFTVVNAVNGDEASIRAIMRFFSPTVQYKATRPFIDDRGNRTYYVDPFVHGYIESKLMEAILQFPRSENK